MGGLLRHAARHARSPRKECISFYFSCYICCYYRSFSFSVISSYCFVSNLLTFLIYVFLVFLISCSY